MENLKKRKIRAYLLLESLMALALFAFISQNLIVSIVDYQRVHKEWMKEKEQLLVARMALQTNQEYLEINNCKIKVQKDFSKILVYQEDEILINVKKKN